MNPPSLLRRLYDSVALFALLNMLLLVGLAALGMFSGALSPEKVQAIAAVLKGSAPETATPAVELPVETTAVEEASEPSLPVLPDEEKNEIIRREAERIKEELRQRLALNNSILLRVQAEREAFQKEQADAARLAVATARQRDTEGFRKQIEILEGLKPKAAVQHLLGQSEVDEAARLLVEMDTRKAQKIVQAASDPPQLQRMMTILQRLREVAPEKSAELAAGGIAQP